jgi:hypothetical protein
MQMFNAEHLQEKWAPLLDYDGAEKISDSHKRMVTAVLLENQEKFLQEERQFLSEDPTNSAGNGGFSGSATKTGPVAGFDPVLISLIRRSMPNLVAYDLAGVQPMNGPTGLIFAMRSRYTNQSGTETFFDEVDTAFSGQNDGGGATQGDYTAGTDGSGSTGFGTTGQGNGTEALTNPALLAASDASQAAYPVGQGMSTADAEDLGDGSGDQFNQMAFSIEKVTVTAKSRALKAEYSLELAQDLKAIHGLNAEAELANILSTEILAEINREVIRTIYKAAEVGAQTNVANTGTFDLDVDSNGRWSVEKFKGLLFQIEREANAIAQRTRRGKGNMILCSADVASALTMTTLVTPSLVFCKVSIVYTSILILLTCVTPSTSLLVIRVLPLMTLVCSTAHTFLFRWFVPLVRIHSNPRSDSRLATAWSPIHSLKVSPKAKALSVRTPTVTTDVFVLRTSCDPLDTFVQGDLRVSFFYV